MKFKSNVTKLCNFEKHSPNIAAATSPILQCLINFKIQNGYTFFYINEHYLYR